MKPFTRGIGAIFVLATLGIFPALGQPSAPAFPDPIMPLNLWYFDDTNWVSAADVPPLSQTNLTLVPTWDNNGLQVDSSDPAWLSYPLVSDGWPNLLLDTGSVRFWFLPDWVSTNLGGTGPGDWARFIDVGAWTSNASYGWWSLYTDPAGCNLYFSAQTNNGTETNYLSAPISWDDGTWHEIELTYSRSNCALFLDGALVTNGPGISILPPPEALTNGFYIGSDATGNNQAHGQFDQLWTFENQQRDTDEIAAEYAEFALIANPTGFHGNNFSDSFGTFSSGGTINSTVYGSNQLWLEAILITNCDGCGPDLGVVLHGTTNGVFYELLSATNLTPPIGWTVEKGVSGSSSFSLAELFTKNRPALFLCARRTNLDIISQPLSQEVTLFDHVTFSVKAGGVGALTYQWSLNGTNISGATQSSFSLTTVQDSDAGIYTVAVSNGTNSVTSSNAVLICDFTAIIDSIPATYNLIPLTGPRQDFTFKSGITYYVDSPTQLFGHTVIEGGTIIKFDPAYDSTLQIMGSLACETEPYNPAILTVAGDDSAGEAAYWASDGIPWIGTNGMPFLDLSAMPCANISNLMVRFADKGIASAANQIDLWDTEFVACHSATVAHQGATEALHNVLFTFTENAVQTCSNFAAINAEHVTADVTNFWSGPVPPAHINITNSILLGNFASGSIVSTQHVAFNPSGTVFQTAGFGNYYLADNSLRQAGTTNVSQRLLAEFKAKATSPAFGLPTNSTLNGTMTFFPQARRYTNGAPDLGFYYDAIDYTMSGLAIGGTVNLEPGVVFAVHNAILPDGSITYTGLEMLEGSTLTAHGMPTKPIILTAERMVQETPQGYLAYLEMEAGAWFATAAFVPEYFPNDELNPAPVLDFRFCKFYLPGDDYHIWSGLNEYNYSFAASADSAVFLTMRDCAVHGGRIDLGLPDIRYLPQDMIFTNGAIAWTNNLFDNTTINLDPAIYKVDADDPVMNVDLSVRVYNNLFRGCPFFHLEPIPATAGNWVFENNFFEKVAFQQDFNAFDLPLDFDYNGYFPLTPMDISPSSTFFSTLQSTTTGDGFVDGAHEQILSAAPPYQKGVFGNFYLPTNTLLFHAGSTTTDQLGLCHYTTQTNQMRETNAIVSIGLHYLAASSGVALDTDGDGIPDYVENWHGDGSYSAHTDTETDWQTNYTAAGIWDPTNSVYDDTDLSGNGLVGRLKRVLGIEPFSTFNPLQLSQINTGEEPDFATFEVAVNYDALTNSGDALTLHMNGVEVALGDCSRATNGNCLLSFNIAFDHIGQHFLSAEYLLNSDPNVPHPVMTGSGALLLFNSSNSVQFFEAGAMFDSSGGYLDAQLFADTADYQIDLYDTATTPPTWFKSITNSTSNGFIEETWDGMLADGVTAFTNDEVKAVFTVAYADSAANISTNKPSKVLTKAKGSLSEWGPNMDVVYFRTQTNDAWASDLDKGGVIWNGIQATVNVLLDPNNGYDIYQSYFNRYPPDSRGEYPGYITKRARSTNDVVTLPTVVDTLLPDLKNSLTKQIYIYGHGTNGWMANYDSSAYITAQDVSSNLANTFSKRKGLNVQNPYRFVWLDGCSTASGKDWRRAFGIYPIGKGAQEQAARNKTGPQAYIGWKSVHGGPLNWPTHDPLDVSVAAGYTKTLSTFYTLWMLDFPVRECLDQAAKVRPNQWPIPVPQNENITNTFNGESYIYTNLDTSKIFIVGFPGLKVDQTDHSLDGDIKYAAPEDDQ